MRPDHLGQVINNEAMELVDSSWVNVLTRDPDLARQIEVTFLHPINKNTATDVMVALGAGPDVSTVTDLNLRFPCHAGGGGSVEDWSGAPLELPPGCSLFAKVVDFDDTAVGSALAIGAGVQLNAIGYFTKG